MSATPWIQDGLSTIQYVTSGNSTMQPTGWNPCNILEWGQPITYSLNATWQFNPSFHVFNVVHDGIAAQTLQIQLPIMSHLYDESAMWFFWLGTSVPDAILQFSALADDSSVNGTAGPAASYSFTCDGAKHLFMVIATNGKYIIKTVSGRDISLTAGAGISIVAGPLSDFTIDSFSGAVGAFGGATAAATTDLFFGLTAANATETSVSQWIAPRAGVISQLYIKLNSVLAVGTNTLAATLRKNAADQALTCTVALGASTASDVVNSFSVVAGDLITLKSKQSDTGEVKQLSASFSFRPSSV